VTNVHNAPQSASSGRLGTLKPHHQRTVTSVRTLAPIADPKPFCRLHHGHPYFTETVKAELIHLLVRTLHPKLHPVPDVVVGHLRRNVAQLPAGEGNRLAELGCFGEAVTVQLRL